MENTFHTIPISINIPPRWMGGSKYMVGWPAGRPGFSKKRAAGWPANHVFGSTHPFLGYLYWHWYIIGCIFFIMGCIFRIMGLDTSVHTETRCRWRFLEFQRWLGVENEMSPVGSFRFPPLAVGETALRQ